MITIDELKKIVIRGSVEEVRDLKVEDLPNDIPENIVEHTDDEFVSAVVEDLLLEANAYHMNIRNQIEETYGAEVADALDRSKKQEIPLHSIFKNKLKELIELYKIHRNDPVQKQTEIFSPHIEQLETQFIDIKEEAGACARGSHELKKMRVIAGDFMEQFRTGSKLLSDKYDDLDRSMNLYYYVRVIIAANEMQAIRDEGDRLDSHIKRLQVQVDVAREEIKHVQSSLMKSAKEKARLEELRNQVSNLLEEMSKHEILISETELIAWLDLIVESSMSEYILDRAGQVVRSGRLLLFNLLQKYCEIQEAAAQQIARNPFSQSDPKQTIKFMLKSEQFILSYFAKKKTTMTSWLGGVAESKIEELNSIEKQLLTEMKQNSKKLK